MRRDNKFGMFILHYIMCALIIACSVAVGELGWLDSSTRVVAATAHRAHPTCYLPYNPSYFVRSACQQRGYTGERCNIQPGWDFQPRGTLGRGNSKPRDDWIVPPQAIETMPCSLLNQGESILTEMSGLLLLNGALYWP